MNESIHCSSSQSAFRTIITRYAQAHTIHMLYVDTFVWQTMWISGKHLNAASFDLAQTHGELATPHNYSRGLFQLVNIFWRVRCRWNNFEINSVTLLAAEIILFQFETWLHAKWNIEVFCFTCEMKHWSILFHMWNKTLKYFVSHVTVALGCYCAGGDTGCDAVWSHQFTDANDIIASCRNGPWRLCVLRCHANTRRQTVIVINW